jgi:hypothetical protein
MTRILNMDSYIKTPILKTGTEIKTRILNLDSDIKTRILTTVTEIKTHILNTDSEIKRRITVKICLNFRNVSLSSPSSQKKRKKKYQNETLSKKL